jgi:16S rRNA (uracil1498-N3)-methyltransferase
VKTFYLPPADWREPYILQGREAKHAAKVMRLSAGDRIRLMDGRGSSGEFEISAASKSKLDLKPVEITSHAEPDCRIHLAVGWVKSARRAWLMEKAVELGAWGLIFWQGEHSQGRVPGEPKETWHEKLAEAMKQCGNPWLPELDVLTDGVAQLAEYASGFDRRYLLLESREPENSPQLIDPGKAGAPGDTLLAVGPEGGISEHESKTLIDSGFAPVSLGRRILRYETAAITALALAWWGAELRAEEY